ncbi:alpha-L-rhamnosidase [Arthrobacter ramosus]|uniref:alpha-L-rhamnosidase n=1 Tax=Arthrobacter ramosus TaxID=1672 RepID=A0ABV5XZY5_ARTRM|nr:alpha-L-rhamnosidase [Arthrobacter ramosus]
MARLTNLRVNRLTRPLAIDTDTPRFGWALESDDFNHRQEYFQIEVTTAAGDPVWDSGRVISACSQEIAFGNWGELHGQLTPEGKYTWTVTVWDNKGRELSAVSTFETAMFATNMYAWDGAQWIGASRPHLDSHSLVVYRVRCLFRIPQGSTMASFILGANDFRLRHEMLNEYRLAGENHVRFSVDVGDPSNPAFRIFRLGYAIGDRPDLPLIDINAGACATNLPELLPGPQAHQENEIELICESSTFKVRINGKYLLWNGSDILQVNPRGMDDVAAYPVLGEVGFQVLPAEQLDIRNYEIRNYRDPQEALFDSGDYHVFAQAGGVGIDGNCLAVHGGEDGRTIIRDPSRGALPILRRKFQAQRDVTGAKIYITARGIYELHVNGEKIGNDWFNPGSSDYRYTIEYSAYDISEQIRTGDNTLTVTLAPGWWADMMSFMETNTNFYGDRPSLLCKMVLDYSDGSSQILVSSPGSWEVHTGGPTKNGSFFQGERYDARDELSLTDENRWGPAAVVLPLERNAQPQLVSKPDEPVRVFEVLESTLIGEARPGSDSWIYDMGVNMVGVPELTFDGREGQEIVIRTAEVLYPPLEEYLERDIDGLLMTENLREAMSTDVYTCREGLQKFTPRFTFHGYRYIQISGTRGPIPAANVKGIVLSSIAELTGKVSTSNPLLNQLADNIHRSQIGNFLSIPTDCPQRNERMGWLESVTEFARTSCFSSDVQKFYEHYLRIVRDSQVTKEILSSKTDAMGFYGPGSRLFKGDVVTGMYPSYAPAYDAYRSWGTPWSSAGVLLPFEVYSQYGTTSVIEQSFESMLTYLEAMEGLRMRGAKSISIDGGVCGDWLSLDKPPYSYTDASIYVYMLGCFAKMATAIGEDEVASSYQSRHAAAKEEWNELYIDPGTGGFRDDLTLVNVSQSSCSLALHFDLPLEKYSASIFEALCEKVAEGYAGRPYCITTGLFTTPIINLVLSDHGRSDLAYRMIENTAFPSWLYPVTQGATSSWERWDSYTAEDGFGGNNAMNSFNHFSLGAVGAWLFNRVAGIDRDAGSAGMQHFVLHPVPGGSLTHASAAVMTDYGRIQVQWTREDEGHSWHCRLRIPANMSARIELPWAPHSAHSSVPADVNVVDDKNRHFQVPSGSWHLSVDQELLVIEKSPEKFTA